MWLDSIFLIFIKFIKAVYMERKGKIDKAIASYKKLAIRLERFPQLASFFYQRAGKLLIDIKKIKEAKNCFQKAFELTPESSSVNFWLAFISDDEEDFLKAAFHYEKVLAVNPKNYEARNNLSLVYYALAQQERALQREEKAHSLEQKALKHIKEALRIAPNNFQLLSNSGYLYYRLGEIKKAIEIFRKTLQKTPYDYTALSSLYEIYYKLGEIDEANRFFNSLLDKNPGNVELIYNLGAISGEVEKYKDAIKYWEKVLDIDPEHPLTLNNLGVIYMEQGEYIKALELFERAKKVAIGDREFQGTIRYNMGKCYFSMNKYYLAEKYLEEAMRLQPLWAEEIEAILLEIKKYREETFSLEEIDIKELINTIEKDLLQLKKPYSGNSF